MAKPLIEDPKIRHAVLERLREGNTLKDAAALSGIGLRTLHEWLERGDDRHGGDDTMYNVFAREVVQARAYARSKCVQTIRQASAEDPKWAAWYLERTDPENWSRKPPQSDRQAYLDDRFLAMMRFQDREREETARDLAQAIEDCFRSDDEGRRLHLNHDTTVGRMCREIEAEKKALQTHPVGDGVGAP